jgi:hypothetical protein
MIYHNSQEEYYRNPKGALEVGSALTIRIKVPEKIKKIFLYYWTESTGNVKVAMNLHKEEENYSYYSVTFNVGMKPQLLWYNFGFGDEEFFMEIIRRVLVEKERFIRKSL